MKILTVGMRGFGKFADKEFNFTDGLNVVCGPNESGKSTIQACIARVLFGSPPVPFGLPEYQPLSGAPYVAWLRLQSDSNVVYRVERGFSKTRSRQLAVSYVREGGLEAPFTRDPDEWGRVLHKELGIPDEKVFYCTVCISQADLNPLDKKLVKRLSGAERVAVTLRPAIERAVAGSAGNETAASAQRTLTTHIERIFHPRATVHKGELFMVRQRFPALETQAEKLRTDTLRAEELQTFCRQLQAQIEERRERLASLRSLLDTYTQRRREEDRLKQVSSELEQVNRRLEQIQKLTEERTLLDTQLAKVPRVFHEHPRLRGDTEKLAEETTTAEQQISEYRRQSAACTEELAQLHINVKARETGHVDARHDRERLEEQVRLLKRKSELETLRTQASQRASELRKSLVQIAEANRTLAALNAQIDALPEVVRTNPTLADTAARLAVEVEHRSVAHIATQERTRSAGEQLTFIPSDKPLRLGGVIAITFGLLSLILPLFEVLVYIVALLLVLGCVGGFAFFAQAHKVARHRRAVEDAYRTAQQSEETALAELTSAQNELGRLLVQAKMSSVDDLQALTQGFKQLMHERDLAERTRQTLLAGGSEDIIRRDITSLEKQMNDLSAQLTSLPTDGAVNLSETQAALTQAKSAEEDAAQQLEKTRHDLATTQERLRLATESEEKASKLLAQLHAKREELLRETGCVSLEEVIIQARAYEQSIQRWREVESVLQSLTHGESLEELAERKRTLALDFLAVQEKLRTYPSAPLTASEANDRQRELERLERELPELQAQYNNADVERRALLRQEGNLIEIEEEIADLKRREARLILQWAALTKAKEVLREASEYVHSDIAAPVQQAARSVFRSITRGVYDEVEMKAEPNTSEFEFVAVLTPTGERWLMDNLSRGTRDQLYFALRYAFAKVLIGDDREPLLILDDPFVNYDPDRTRAVLDDALRPLCGKTQILLFTKDEGAARHVQGWANIIFLTQD